MNIVIIPIPMSLTRYCFLRVISCEPLNTHKVLGMYAWVLLA
jgi:hypothetical protein